MNKFYAWFRILRPPIIFIAVFGSVAVALSFWKADTDPLAFAIAMFGWGMLWGGIMVHNDYYDLESDTKNRPNKPIPCGAITPFQAKWGGLALMVVGTMLIFLVYLPINLEQAILSGFWALTLFIVGIVYNTKGKDWGLSGHMQVAWGVAIIPFFGAAVVDPYFGALALAPLFIYIFIAEIGREILVCTGDYFGDVKQGWGTVPVRVGRKRAMWITLFFYTLAIPFYAVPYTGWFNFPVVFGPVFFWGYTIFVIGLYVMWAGVYRTLIKGDEKKTWAASELYSRTGTRLLIIFTEFVLLAEAFF